MSNIVIGTNTVSLDEPCYNLSEVDLPGPGNRSINRYQILTVVRGDNLVELRRNLGLSKNFKASQFRIPGGVTDYLTGKFECLHKVGELIDIANHLREVYPEPQLPPSRLIKDYFEWKGL